MTSSERDAHVRRLLGKAYDPEYYNLQPYFRTSTEVIESFASKGVSDWYIASQPEDGVPAKHKKTWDYADAIVKHHKPLVYDNSGRVLNLFTKQ